MREQLEKLHAELQTDLKKFLCDGNKAAGTRSRVKCQELKKYLSEIRSNIQQLKKEK